MPTLRTWITVGSGVLICLFCQLGLNILFGNAPWMIFIGTGVYFGWVVMTGVFPILLAIHYADKWDEEETESILKSEQEKGV